MYARTGSHLSITRFLSVTGRLVPLLAVCAILALMVALFMASQAPEDVLHGRTVLILFVHVPMAMLGLILYFIMALAAFLTLLFRYPLADITQKAAAPVGACFALLCLITGSLWGRPAWGTYWVWDARLTSMLILFLMYCGSIALWNAIENPQRASRAVAILNLVGGLNALIVKYSVNIWNTQHQKSSLFAEKGVEISGSLLSPLLAMIVAFSLIALTLVLAIMRTEILRRSIRHMRIQVAEQLDV